MEPFRSTLVFLIISLFFSFDALIPVPSCKISNSDEGGDEGKRRPNDVTVMMMADLMLKGSDAGFVDRYFRDHFIAKFLKKSLERLQPDLLLVLGDISAKGYLLMASKWMTILQQFQEMLGPYVGTPLHIVLGDSDIGECSKLDENFVSQITSTLPGLNSAGCGAFKFSNISFVSLNAIALLCGNNKLRFGVEKIIESEHLDLQTQKQDVFEESTGSNKMSVELNNLYWRQNDAASGSGPVVLLHLPLHQTTRSNAFEGSITLVDRGIADARPYDLTQTLPENATEYIFHSLMPRMVFSAHLHRFYDYSHIDGTREVTVPAMSWATKRDPGFIVAIFGKNKAVAIKHCSIPKESYIIAAYLSMFILFLASTCVARL